jgi:hypothetical protein
MFWFNAYNAQFGWLASKLQLSTCALQKEVNPMCSTLLAMALLAVGCWGQQG